MSKDGIKTEEQLLWHIDTSEKIAIKNFRHWKAETDKDYNQLWETGIERKMLKLLSSAPKEIFNKWLDIEENRKPEWIKKMKNEHKSLESLNVKVKQSNIKDNDRNFRE